MIGTVQTILSQTEGMLSAKISIAATFVMAATTFTLSHVDMSDSVEFMQVIVWQGILFSQSTHIDIQDIMTIATAINCSIIAVYGVYKLWPTRKRK